MEGCEQYRKKTKQFSETGEFDRDIVLHLDSCDPCKDFIAKDLPDKFSSNTFKDVVENEAANLSLQITNLFQKFVVKHYIGNKVHFLGPVATCIYTAFIAMEDIFCQLLKMDKEKAKEEIVKMAGMYMTGRSPDDLHIMIKSKIKEEEKTDDGTKDPGLGNWNARK